MTSTTAVAPTASRSTGTPHRGPAALLERSPLPEHAATPPEPVEGIGKPSSSPEPAEGRQLTHRQILEVMTGLLAALFTAMLSTTIVSTALPTIMADLNGTQRQYTWVITASLLAMTISTPIWGKLSDLFNKKFLVQLSIVVFVAGSVGAGLSQSVPPMMTFRALQGIGMGGLVALTQSIMGAIIPPRQRGRYSGYMGAVMAVSTVSGPLLGGVISDSVSWRWCFFVCVPLAVVALILLQITLHAPAVVKRKVHIDYLGAVLIAIVAALPMLWVTFAGQDYAWVSWQSGLFLGGFAVATVLAIVTELKAREPMVPIRVLRNRTTALMIVASIGVGVALFGSSTFLTQYFQLAGGHSPTRAGLMTIPLIIAQMLSSTLGGQLVTKTGRWKPLMVVGSILLVAGLAILGTVDHETPYWQVAIAMSVMGLGVGALIQNIVLAVQNTVDVSQIGASSATISFFRSLGGAVGVAVLGAILANHVEDRIVTGLTNAGISGAGGSAGTLDLKDLPGPIRMIVRAAYGDSFGTLFLIAAAFALVTLVAIALVHEVPLRNTIELKPEADSDANVGADASGASVETSTSSAAIEGVAVPANVTDVGDPEPSNADLARPNDSSTEADVLAEAQRQADSLLDLARHEAERILTIADTEVETLQQRIDDLRQIEAHLSAKVFAELEQLNR